MKKEDKLKNKLTKAKNKLKQRIDKYNLYISKLEEIGLDWTDKQTMKVTILNNKVNMAIVVVETCQSNLNQYYKNPNGPSSDL